MSFECLKDVSAGWLIFNAKTATSNLILMLFVDIIFEWHYIIVYT